MNRILKNWDFARIVRLLLGVLIAIYSISSQNYIFLVFGGWLLFQAIMNISCCGTARCYTDTKYKENIYGDQIKKYKPD
ncbi:hypothetical protein [Parabacteroides sp. Marseille-P3160]|uniref:hypothetical protein n=1 Tax=Parabacteroides sp. Marseille-P3160 TaxID=1917887 RepID=UPI0009BB7D2B|nr:hypothetical protein [Parabacteroides sp. Marseille-P3160]